MATQLLKPFRQYSEADVINLFAYNDKSGDKGTLVKITSTSGFVSSQDLGWVDLTSVANVISQRPYLYAQVGPAASGEGAGDILGMMLYDVREVNFLGVPLIYDRVRRDEAQCSVSGEAVPVVKKGIFLVYVGTGSAAGPQSGALVADAGAGGWKVVAKNTAKSIGQFLGKPDSDGYAAFYLNV